MTIYRDTRLPGGSPQRDELGLEGNNELDYGRNL